MKSIKSGIYANFDNEDGRKMFTPSDIAYWHEFYRLVENPIELEMKMQEAYTWGKLPSRDHAPSTVVTDFKHKLDSAVPPITCTGYTKTDRDKLIEKEKLLREKEMADPPDDVKQEEKIIDDAVARMLKEKDPSRGIRAMSKNSRKQLLRMEREVLTSALKDRRAAGAVPTALPNECRIVGAVTTNGKAAQVGLLVECASPSSPTVIDWVLAHSVDNCDSIEDVAKGSDCINLYCINSGALTRHSGHCRKTELLELNDADTLVALDNLEQIEQNFTTIVAHTNTTEKFDLVNLYECTAMQLRDSQPILLSHWMLASHDTPLNQKKLQQFLIKL